MTACTQPACTGTIVDGYCDVCGSPAGAAPFVPAKTAASAASHAPADGPGPMAVRRVWGLSPEPKKRDLMTACTQPGCTGTAVDGYCDVCGSPAAAVPFVLAETAALEASAASADEPGLAAVPAPIPAPAHVAEGMPTQPIPRALVEEESPTQLIPRALVEEESPTQLIPRALVEEESPTQLIPRALVEEESPTQLIPRALVEEEPPTQLIPRALVEEEPPTQLIPRALVEEEPSDSADPSSPSLRRSHPPSRSLE